VAAKKQRRALKPSRSLIVGTPVGTALAVIICSGLTTAGVAVTPEMAGAPTTVCVSAVSWLTQGGRRGEGA